MANRKAIFVVHADGTVIGSHGAIWLTGDALSTALHPGDMLVAPEKSHRGTADLEDAFSERPSPEFHHHQRDSGHGVLRLRSESKKSAFVGLLFFSLQASQSPRDNL